MALIGITELLFSSLALVIVLGFFAFWIWMLVDCVRNRVLSDNERLVWVIAICLTHVLGALIYFFAGRRSGAA